ncbi:MAG: hypothetical protein D8M59_12320 [Planctomycetes bacterium]|nr:hypothetical protein [Planctomycetota bacterium]NOG53594.1 hypothetical protein [Planctomycetota bacterium]
MFDRFRQTMGLVQAQLGRLYPIHKLLIGSAAVIAAMTLFIVSQYAGKPRMVMVAVDPDQRSIATGYLQANGIKYEVSEGGLYVPSTEQMEVTAILSERGALGTDVSSMLLELLQNQPWYANREQTQAIRDAAMNRVLSQIMTGWSYIKRADVVITSPKQSPGRSAMRNAAEPTASVSIMSRGGALTPEQVAAISDFVAGAVQGLTPSNVHITDGGRRYRTPSAGESTSGSNIDLRMKHESYFEEKILEALRYIPNVIAVVSAQVDTTQEVVRDIAYKPEDKGSVSFPTDATSKTTQRSGSSSGGEPGVRPNTGMTVSPSSGGSGESDSTEETTESFKPYAGMTETERTNSKGIPLKINATVGVPRSYLLKVWQDQNPDVTDPPGDAVLEAMPEMTRIKDAILPLVETGVLAGLNDESSGGDVSIYQGEVVVSMFREMNPTQMGEAATEQAGGAFSIPGLDAGAQFIGSSARTIGVVGLSLISLFIMLRLVRGSKAEPDLPSVEELVGIPPSLQTAETELIGEADASDAPMDAVELDDEEIRSQRLLEQMDELIKGDAKEVSRLMTRWINE